MYADIGHISLQQHQRPTIPVLDDTPIEYAKINHNSIAEKKSIPMTADKTTVNDQLNGIIDLDLLMHIYSLIIIEYCNNYYTDCS